jgi:hypothetical protein
MQKSALIAAMALVSSVLASSAVWADAATFKMYPNPATPTDRDCDVYTELTLEPRPDGIVATAVDRVEGRCELPVAPNPRVYRLTLDEEACGIRHYSADDGQGHEATLDDNRATTCDRFEVSARVVLVEKNRATGIDSWLFSQD